MNNFKNNVIENNFIYLGVNDLYCRIDNGKVSILNVNIRHIPVKTACVAVIVLNHMEKEIIKEFGEGE